MNRRSRLQLRLQQTVEGLSVVAITYYATQLVHYLARGAQEFVSGINTEVISAAAIPVIGCAVGWTLHRMRNEFRATENDIDKRLSRKIPLAQRNISEADAGPRQL